MNKGWIFITGTSSGIGQHAAKYLSSKGYQVIAGVRDQQSYDRYISIENIHPFIFDTTIEKHHESLVKHLTLNNISLLAIVNNAGVSVWGPILDIPIQYWREIFEVNLFSNIRVTKILLPFLNPTNGKIIQIGSSSDRLGVPLMGAYPIAKLSILRFTEILRRELLLTKKYNKIRVSNLSLGSIKTPIWIKAKNIRFDKNSPIFNLAKEQGLSLIDKEYENATSPLVIAKLIEKIINSKKPRRNYLAGRQSYLLHCFGLMPIFVQDFIFKVMGVFMLKKSK